MVCVIWEDTQRLLTFTGNLARDGELTSNQLTKNWTAAPLVTTIQLAPETATNDVGKEHCVIATVHQNDILAEGVEVNFMVTGANPTSGFVPTGENGEATFCYMGTKAGEDAIVASLDTIRDTASKTWTADVAFTCPRSQGFWKTHPTEWPVDSLMLGSVSYTKDELLKILKTTVGGDASIILAYQLIAAKLNIANGADPDPIMGTIADADALLGSKKVPQKIKPPSAAGKKMTSAASILDRYNNGKLTPDCIRSKKTAKAKKKLKVLPLIVKEKKQAVQNVKAKIEEKLKSLAVGLKKKEIKPITIIKPKSRGK